MGEIPFSEGEGAVAGDLGAVQMRVRGKFIQIIKFIALIFVKSVIVFIIGV